MLFFFHRNSKIDLHNLISSTVELNLFPPWVGLTIQPINIVVQHFFLLCNIETSRKQILWFITVRCGSRVCFTAYLWLDSKYDIVSWETHSTNLCLSRKRACCTLDFCWEPKHKNMREKIELQQNGHKSIFDWISFNYPKWLNVVLSCNFFSSTSKVLSSPPPAIVELLDRFTFLVLALYLELVSLVLVLSDVELELDRDDSEIERDGCFKGSLLVKASFPSSTVFNWTLLEHFRELSMLAFGTLSFCRA